MVLISGNTAEILTNSSIVRASSTGSVGEVQCVSGSAVPYTGSWTFPSGDQSANITDVSFDVVIGGESDPGFASIQLPPGASLNESDEGVYTCHVPDESGVMQIFHVGIYLSSFSGKFWTRWKPMAKYMYWYYMYI